MYLNERDIGRPPSARSAGVDGISKHTEPVRRRARVLTDWLALRIAP